MYLRESNVRSHNLDVQETNFSSHSSTESEAVSLDVGLRMDGILALGAAHSSAGTSTNPSLDSTVCAASWTWVILTDSMTEPAFLAFQSQRGLMRLSDDKVSVEVGCPLDIWYGSCVKFTH